MVVVVLDLSTNLKFLMKIPPSKLDEVVKVDDDYNLYLCGSSLLHLVGTEIDYGYWFGIQK